MTMTQSSIPSIDISSCDHQEIRFPGAIMPHGTILVISRRSLEIAAYAANVFDYLNVPEATSDDLPSLFPEELWLRIRLHTGGYLDRFILQNNHVIDVTANTDHDYIIVDIERVNTPVEDAHDNPISVIEDTRKLQLRLKTFHSEEDIRQVSVNAIREIIEFDHVQFLIMNIDGTMETVAESGNGHYPSFLGKRFPRSDMPTPARKNAHRHDTIYAPEIDYSPIDLISCVPELAANKIDLTASKLRSLAPQCNQFYLNVGVHAKLVLNLIDNDKIWGLVIAWNHQPKPISLKHRMLCRDFLNSAGTKIINERENRDRNQYIFNSNYIDDFLDEQRESSDPTKNFSHLVHLISRLIPCCGAAVVTKDKIYTDGTCPENAQLRGQLDSIYALNVQHDNAAFYIQEPYSIVRLSGFMALPLINKKGYVALFRKEEIATVKWAGNPQKPVEIDEISGIKRLTPRGSFQTWRQEIQQNAAPWERSEIDIFQKLVNGLNTILGSIQVPQSSLESTHPVEEKPRAIESTSKAVPATSISGLQLVERTLKNTIKMMPVAPRALILESDFLSTAHLAGLLDDASIETHWPENLSNLSEYLSSHHFDIIFLATDHATLAWKQLVDNVHGAHPETKIVAIANKKLVDDEEQNKISAFIARPILASDLYQTIINCLTE